MTNTLKNFWNNRIATKALVYQISDVYHHRVIKLDWPFGAVKSSNNNNGVLRYELRFKDAFFEYSIDFRVENGIIYTVFHRWPINCQDDNYVSLCNSWIVEATDKNIYQDEKGNLRYACECIPMCTFK